MSTQVFPTPPTGSGGGGGGTPASSVVSETSYGQSPVVGVSTDFARADHTHGTPAAGAPVGAQYVTLATDATLTNERVLAVTSGDLTKTDGGAGGNVTLGLATVGTLAPGTYTNATVTVDAKGRVTVAASGTAGVSAHTELATLGWSAAGHTGTQTSVACFNGTGAAQTVQATADGQVLQRIGGVLVFASVVASVGIGAAEDRTRDVWYFAGNADIIETGSAAAGPGSIV